MSTSTDLAATKSYSCHCKCTWTFAHGLPHSTITTRKSNLNVSNSALVEISQIELRHKTWAFINVQSTSPFSGPSTRSTHTQTRSCNPRTHSWYPVAAHHNLAPGSVPVGILQEWSDCLLGIEDSCCFSEPNNQPYFDVITHFSIMASTCQHAVQQER